MSNIIDFLERLKKKSEEEYLISPEGQLEKEWRELGIKAINELLTLEEQQLYVKKSLELNDVLIDELKKMVSLYSDLTEFSKDNFDKLIKLFDEKREDQSRYMEEYELMEIFITSNDDLQKEFEAFKKEVEEDQ